MTADKKRATALTFLSVLTRPDPGTVKSVTTEDFIWSFPGASPISGEAHGVEGVIKRAQTIAAYGVKVETIGTVYGSSGVGVILHNTGNKNGRNLDEQVVAVFAFRGDKLSRLDTHLSDVAMAEAFFG